MKSSKDFARPGPAEEIRIKPRRVDFKISDEIPRHWNDGDPVKTHLLNAFSSLLPAFERFFIEVLARNQQRVTETKLQEEIRGFCAQEGSHALQHRKYNQLLVRQGYKGLPFFEKILTKILRLANACLPRDFLLGMTAGGEHITSFLGHDFLSRPARWSKNSDPALNALWAWHAVEELEHKAVCYDVFQDLCGRRWVRIMAFEFINISTMVFLFLIQIYLLWTDGLIFRFRTWKNYFRFMCGADGFYWSLWREALKYSRRDFHPWQVDDSALISAWTKNQAATS